MLDRPSSIPKGQLLTVFIPGLTAMVGFWATLSLNIPDFTRFARSQRDQIVGQALGLPATMVLFSFIGVAVTSATQVIFGEVIWDPVTLLGPVGGIMIADYYLLRRRELSVADLYRRGGIYEYRSGFNPIALGSLAFAVALNLPGFIATAFPSTAASVPAFWQTWYTYAWFNGFLVAGALYLGCSRLLAPWPRLQPGA